MLKKNKDILAEERNYPRDLLLAAATGVLLVAVEGVRGPGGVGAVLVVQKEVAAVGGAGSGPAAGVVVGAQEAAALEEELPIHHVQVDVLHAVEHGGIKWRANRRRRFFASIRPSHCCLRSLCTDIRISISGVHVRTRG